MARLRRAVGLSLLLASCASSPPGGPQPQAPVAPALPSVLERTSPEGQGVPPWATVTSELPSPLDLDHWPFGWVDDGQGLRLGHAVRFWSDRRPQWVLALSPQTAAATAAQRLKALYEASTGEEKLRAAWALWRLHSRAGLGVEARQWLDRVVDLDARSPVVSLERIWDQNFRLHDAQGARSLWPPNGWSGLAPDDALKAGLLRQRLFLGVAGLTDAGSDGYVSALALDQDDLWVGTWNGSVVRWSLVTGELTSILTPARVAPVTRLIVTGWFVYAFQDQGLLRYSKVTGAWRTFPYPPGWTGLRITGALSHGEDSLTVSYLGQGLWRWDKGDWTALDGAGGGPFITALADLGGGFLVGTKDRGLWTWDQGQWNPVVVKGGVTPTNISVLAPSGSGLWAVGTWGEGTWLFDGRILAPLSQAGEFVTSVAWTQGAPLWGLLDLGLRWNPPGSVETLGPRDGLPPGGVTTLATWNGRWLWGTSGQGVGWWSEHENSEIPR